jgi:hypothetical protein
VASPLTEAEQAYIREAYTRRESHRDIAAHLGRPKSTVGQWMTRNGLRYDSTNQKAAIEANVLTAQERISTLRLDVIGIAEHEAAAILAVYRGDTGWKTVLKTQGGGEAVQSLDFIPPMDKRSNANSLASHAGTIQRLAPKETENNEAAKSMIDAVIEGLGIDEQAPDQSETA